MAKKKYFAPRKKCGCGHVIRSAQDLCIFCRKGQRSEDKMVEIFEQPTQYTPKVWSPPTKEETLSQLRTFVGKFIDFGEHGPVKHYRPGDPDFAQLAAQYGG